MGYDDVEVPVEGRSEINISMSMNQEVLEEAMVVGFGTQKKISVIGAQQSITATDIKVPVANVTNSLAGRGQESCPSSVADSPVMTMPISTSEESLPLQPA